MSVSVLVAVLSLIVSSGTLFLISYLERKQTRQVEAYKRDPSVGLCPPPTWLWVVTARHGPRLVRYCITYGASLFLVISGLSKSGPATRWSVFLIAYGIGTLVLNLSLEITFRVNRSSLEMLQAVQNLVGATIETQGAQAKSFEGLARVVSGLVDVEKAGRKTGGQQSLPENPDPPPVAPRDK